MRGNVEPTERMRVVIELELGSDPISGRIEGGDHETDFVGWLALVRALEGAARRRPQPSPE